MVQSVDGSGHFLHSNEVVTQEDPLSIIAYSIGILLLIHELCVTHPHVLQPWYADDEGAGVKYVALQDNIQYMIVRGPPQGYFPETTNSILAVLYVVPRIL